MSGTGQLDFPIEIRRGELRREIRRRRRDQTHSVRETRPLLSDHIEVHEQTKAERGDWQREAEGDHGTRLCADYPVNFLRCQAQPKKAFFGGCRIQKNPYVPSPL
jgi:hypothetical protein